MNHAIHFVGFCGDECHRACRVFGTPDLVHMRWDRRARREIANGDVVLFAGVEHDQRPAARKGDDILEELPA